MYPECLPTFFRRDAQERNLFDETVSRERAKIVARIRKIETRTGNKTTIRLIRS